MIHYLYDLDGFTLAESATDIYDGQDVENDHNKSLEAAGWVRCFLWGPDPDPYALITVYQQESNPGRGLYVDISELNGSVYTCMVTPRAWPQFYRTELLPILQARYTAEIHRNHHRLANIAFNVAHQILKTPGAPDVQPPVTPPGKGNTK